MQPANEFTEACPTTFCLSFPSPLIFLSCSFLSFLTFVTVRYVDFLTVSVFSIACFCHDTVSRFDSNCKTYRKNLFYISEMLQYSLFLVFILFLTFDKILSFKESLGSITPNYVFQFNLEFILLLLFSSHPNYKITYSKIKSKSSHPFLGKFLIHLYACFASYSNTETYCKRSV